MKKLSSLLLVLLALLPRGARGATVTRLADDNDPGSLRWAIANTAASGTVSFAPTLNGLIGLDAMLGPLVIDKDLQVTGPGASLLTVSGGGNSQVFLIVAPAANVELSGLTIADGFSSANGGGVQHTSGALTINGCAISGNMALSFGAGIFSAGAALNILNSSIASNNAQPDGEGGGVYLAAGSLVSERSTLSGNFAVNGGALFVALGATATLSNDTIANNNAISLGGGLFNYGSSAFYQCTIAGNAAGGGGGIRGVGGSVQLAGTILAANAGGNFINANGTSLGYNRSDDGSAGFLTAPGDAQVTPVQLALDPSGLQNNGGPTLTIALQANSSAVNAGDPFFICAQPPCYDQRGVGFPRVQGAALDIGAFEVQAVNHAPSVICPIPVSVDAAGTAGTSLQLIASVLDADGNLVTVTWAVDNVVVQTGTVTAPTSTGVSLTHTYGTGTHSVTVTVSDGIVAPVSCSTTVTVLAPRSAKTAVLSALTMLRNSTTSDRSKFDAAINYLTKSVEMKNWLDDSHPKPGAAGESVFSNEKSAVSQVQGLQTKYPSLTGMINRLVQIDRALAVIEIQYAETHNGNASKLNSARTYLAKGDTDAAAGKPTYAIDDYKNAWKNAVAATP